jgi:hypothetical protein
MKLKLNILTAVLGVSLTLGAVAQEAFQVDLAALPVGPVPKEVLFVVEGVWEAAEKDGVKSLKILPEPISDANAQVGNSAKGDATISARVFATKQARSFPRFGVSVHGMSGYRLMVNGAKKQIELVKSDEVVATAPFVWTSDAWVTLKLEAKREGADGPWSISASAWADGAEPGTPLIQHSDESNMKGAGKCGLWGTPYSEQPIFFADVKGSVKVEG